MPQITQSHTIDITPEKFLNACTPMELQVIDLLIQSPRYQNKMKGYENAQSKDWVSDQLKLQKP